MVYKDYVNKVELSAAQKDPGTQGMLTRPPLLKKDVYGHEAVNIVLRRDSNLGSTPVEPIEEHGITRVHARVLVG